MTPNYLLGARTEDSFSPAEKQMIEKYRKLDTYGKELIDIILEKTYAAQMAHAEISVPLETSRTLAYYEKLNQAIFDGFTLDALPESSIEIPITPETEDADFIVRINGDSMEPTFCDGDKVLVQKTDVVGVGDIGVFFVDGECHIKETGAYGLISHNPKYSLIPGTHSVRCVGRVLDKLS